MDQLGPKHVGIRRFYKYCQSSDKCVYFPVNMIETTITVQNLSISKNYQTEQANPIFFWGGGPISG